MCRMENERLSAVDQYKSSFVFMNRTFSKIHATFRKILNSFFTPFPARFCLNICVKFSKLPNVCLSKLFLPFSCKRYTLCNFISNVAWNQSHRWFSSTDSFNGWTDWTDWTESTDKTKLNKLACALAECTSHY